MEHPFGLQWHITNRCDQRCKHCYIFNASGDRVATSEFSSAEACRLVDNFTTFCSQMGRKPFITITGGDPLLYPNLWEALEYIQSKGIKFSILGNPFHLTEMTAARLKSLGCTSYQMSLDGLENTHDAIRMTGSFRATVDKIAILKDVGIRANIMTTVSGMNYQDIPSLLETIVSAGVSVFAFARYCPTHSDVDFNLSPEEYRLFLVEMWENFQYHAHSGTTFTLKDHLWTLLLYEMGLFEPRPEHVVFEGCGCANAHMTVLEDGTVYACRRFESPVGNALTSDFRSIFLGEQMARYRDIHQLQGCKDCELLYHCRGCHAVSAGSTGDFFQRDPQCWKK
jgi:radical SAM/SPASM domain protein of ACGX system